MLDGEYLEAQRLCESIASGMEPPLFYVDKMAEVEESRAAEGVRDHPPAQ